MTSAITATGLRKSFGGKAVLDGIDLEVGTPAGDLEIGIVEGTAARLAVNTGHERVLNLLESAAGPERATRPSRRGHTSYGDITFHRS
jgi:hypothetical protein